MSLWYKPINEITFADVATFCATKQREGLRLDYKGEWPKDIVKTIAAFANTLGGMILLGVAATKDTNEPIWPPTTIAADDGISERIVQICRDGIYPPVRPQIQIVPTPADPSRVLVVVRIDESPEAPHAINNRTKVYVRTGDVNHPVELADIDRIKYFFDRRKPIEADRDALIDQAIDRALRMLPRHPHVPIRWAAAIPYFPWRELCSHQTCHQFLGGKADVVQRAPLGAIGIGLTGQTASFIDLGGSTVGLRGNEWKTVISANTKGLVFALEKVFRRSLVFQESMVTFLDLTECTRFFKQSFDLASKFFSYPGVEQPGFLQVSIGLLDVESQTLRGGNEIGRGFPDKTYRADRTIAPAELIERMIDPSLEHVSSFENELFRQFAFAFDVGSLNWKIKVT